MDKKDFLPIGPFRGWVLQNFPFIEADFDALTNYQLWCKIVEYVNKIAYNEELLEDSNDELIDAFNELKTYVDNYFDNLDVQDEIDNKLDEMTTDGTFTNLITPIVNAYLDNIDFDTRFSNIENDIDGLESRMDTAESNIGTLSNLGTTNKSNLVSAINEVDSNCDNNSTNIGTLSSLNTTEKSNLVGAINEVNTAVGNVVTSGNTGENYYVKYADGTMICYGQITPSITGGCTTLDGGMYESQEFPVTFAQEFISSPMSLSLSAVRNSNDHVKISVYARSLSKSGFTSWNASHTSINSTGISTYYIAIGKWK